GHLLNPTDPESDDRDWIGDAWRWILGQELGLPVAAPAWLNQPALTRITVSSQTMMRPFTAWNDGSAYVEQIKPANFLLAAQAEPLRNPGIDLGRFRLVAPYDSDPAHWADLPWRNLYNPTGP